MIDFSAHLVLIFQTDVGYVKRALCPLDTNPLQPAETSEEVIIEYICNPTLYTVFND